MDDLRDGSYLEHPWGIQGTFGMLGLIGTLSLDSR